ncbi:MULTISPECIES: PEPxxWA-CTERM sorting domain-containing protein [unclassified Sphingomonas]|uniref:PEPxxWA-CTERM sorting domain-containing protein n=1 Tax=unclassified Sphingomonas TaxID=196159 RepID=UPI001F581C9D|nr:MULTISPECIES: PEPxxWA-CTERM sorting domain-containing protein [unclassified Sphingomonas]
MKKILAAAAVALLATAAPAFAAETVNVAFAPATGGQSVGNYYGLVNVVVTGTGQSDGTIFNDAFYSLDPAGKYNSSYYQLTFGTAPLANATPSQNAANYIVGGLPAYRDDHTYSFTLNTGLAQTAAGKLFFGVSDGVFSDNSGAFQVQLSQAVPEPATWAMMLMGFGMIGFGLRSYQRKSTKVTYA